MMPRARERTARRRVALSEALRILEARTKIVSVSSLLIGTTYAAAVLRRFDGIDFALMFFGTVLVDLGTAGFNSYFDHRRGVDTVDTDTDRYKVLVHEPVDPRVALYLALSMFAGAAAFGLALGARFGWEIVGAGAACMAIAFFYSGGPRPIAGTPVGEVFAGGTLGGVLVVLAVWVQAHAVDRGAVLLGLPSTAMIAAILAVNNTCDMRGDAAAGRRTLAIVLGPRGAQVAHYAMVVGAWLLAAALVPLGVLPPAALALIALAALFGVYKLRQMHRRGYSHATKGPSMGGISAIFLAHTAAILGSLALAAWRAT